MAGRFVAGAFLHALLIRSSRAIRDSNTAFLEEASETEAQLTTARLLQGVREHLAKSSVAAEKEQLRTTAFVGGLERHGVSLEQQVEWFALTQLGSSGSSEEEEAPAVQQPRSLAERERQNSTREPVNIGPMLEEEDFLRQTEGKLALGTVRTFKGVYNALAEIVKAKKLPEPLSKSDPEAYRRARKHRKRKEKMEFLAAMGSILVQKDKILKRQKNVRMSQEQRKRRAEKGEKPKNKVTSLKKLLDSLAIFQGQVADLNQEVVKWQDIVWPSVQRREESKRKRMKAYVKRLVNTGKAKTKQLGAQIWKVFYLKMQEVEQSCNIKHQEDEKQAMRDEGMRDSEAVAQEVIREGGKSTELLEEEMRKADRVLGKAEKLGPEREQRLAKQVEALKDRGHDVEEDASAGSLDSQSFDKLDGELEAIEGTACEAKEWSLAQSLRDMLQKARVSRDDAVPLGAFRGMGGAATILGGGYEEIIDFWNKEIGWFTWGSTQVGFNTLSVGIGGYTGVTWKGYKRDWNLEDCGGGTMFFAASASVPVAIPIAGVSLAGIIGIDADDSSLRWVLDPAGLHAISVGWGMSIGLSVPSPVGLDVSAAFYDIYSSECFGNDLGQFLSQIWLPHCKNCSGTAETLAVNGLRAVIKVATFPLLTEILFSFLAIRVDKIRNDQKVPLCPKEERTSEGPCMSGLYNPDMNEELRCSPSSTRFRQDIRYVSTLVASRMRQATEAMTDLRKRIFELLDDIEFAEMDNDEVPESPEFRTLVKHLKGFEVGCLRAPRERSLHLAPGQTIRSAGLWKSEFELEKLSREELKKLCKDDPDCAPRISYLSVSKKKLIQKLVTSSDVVKETNPYGTCAKHSQCVGANMVCECQEKVTVVGKARKITSTCPGHTGRCTCAPGYCWVKGKGCEKDGFVAAEIGVKHLQRALDEWMVARQIELGSYAVAFQDIVGLDFFKDLWSEEINKLD